MNVTAAEIWGGCRGEGLVGSLEPPKLQTMSQYNTLIWPQNVDNPISKDLNFKIFWARMPQDLLKGTTFGGL